MDNYSTRQLLITMLEYELRNYVQVKLPNTNCERQRQDLMSYEYHIKNRIAELKLAHG